MHYNLSDHSINVTAAMDNRFCLLRSFDYFIKIGNEGKLGFSNEYDRFIRWYSINTGNMADSEMIKD